MTIKSAIQVPKDFDHTKLPSDLQLNKTFSIGKSEYIFEHINDLGLSCCKSVSDEETSEPVEITKYYRIRKLN